MAGDLHRQGQKDDSVEFFLLIKKTPLLKNGFEKLVFHIQSKLDQTDSWNQDMEIGRLYMFLSTKQKT